MNTIIYIVAKGIGTSCRAAWIARPLEKWFAQILLRILNSQMVNVT